MDVQRELRDKPGVSAMIYDQTCASEKRRRRKRNEYPDPAKRAVINEAVCEGCGDCSVQSNCLSVEPLETELGRKRQINQSSCNKDFSCVTGFCPSFVTVEGGSLKKPKKAAAGEAAPPQLPTPVLPSRHGRAPYGILITGIGGTGVVTVGQILAMAAHVEGKGAIVLDMSGLAQKGRPGDVARAPGRQAGRFALDPRGHRQRRSGDRLRPDRHRQPRRAVAHGRRPHLRGDQLDRFVDGGVRQEPGLAVPGRVLARRRSSKPAAPSAWTLSTPARSPPR